MVPANDLLLFAGVAFLIVLTPGPNMIYLVSPEKSNNYLKTFDILAVSL